MLRDSGSAFSWYSGAERPATAHEYQEMARSYIFNNLLYPPADKEAASPSQALLFSRVFSFFFFFTRRRKVLRGATVALKILFITEQCCS